MTQLFADLEEVFVMKTRRHLLHYLSNESNNKSDILACLEIPKVSGPSDAAAIVHMVQLIMASKFAA